MTEAPAQDAPGPERWSPFSGLPVLTMAINITLIAVVFLTRNRWEPWVVERHGPGGGMTTGVVAFSRDARRAVVHRWHPGAHHALLLWDIETSRRLATYQFWPRHGYFATFSPDGTKMLAAAPAAKGGIETVLFDAETGERLAALAGTREVGGLRSGSFSPDGRLVVSAGGAPDGYVRVWRASDGSLALKLGKHARGAYYEAEFSPDGGAILTVGPGDVRVWDARTGELRVRLLDRDAELTRARFCAGGRNVFICSDDRGLLVEAASGARLLELGACGAWAVSDTGGELAAYDESAGALAVLDAASGDTLLERQLREVIDLDFAGNSDRLLAERFKDSARVRTVLDAGTGEVLGELPCDPESRRILSSDGGRLVTRGSSHPVQLYSVRTGQLLADLPEERCEGFLGDERIIVASRGANEGPRVLRRIRPEYWWGVFWLWHLWVIAALVIALAVSIRRDARIMRRERAARAT
ncbi:MAG: WD40 repeat domain-containing protein [Planctomycetota bacterium]